jgi:NADH-quinone oxidoreductase subunit C
MKTFEDMAILTGLGGEPSLNRLDVPKERLREVCTLLKNTPGFYFDRLECVSGVDYGDRFAVYYHLHSLVYEHAVVLRVELDRQEAFAQTATVPTVSDLWRTADWHEREIFDLFGVVFDHHPDLRRILLPDDWQGHPLRKDYRPADQYGGLAI